MNAAIYSRVSTDRQNTINQVAELQRLAAQRNYTVVRTVEEIESGSKRRPALEALLQANGFSVILVWALDRLGRGGALEALGLLESLSKRGISVISAQEPWLDTSTDNPFRDVLISFTATIAKMERARLISRTRAGLAVARAKGKVLGRPSLRLPPPDQQARIVRMWREETGGVDYRALGHALGGVSGATAWRVVKRVA